VESNNRDHQCEQIKQCILARKLYWNLMIGAFLAITIIETCFGDTAADSGKRYGIHV